MDSPWQIVGHNWAVDYFTRSIAAGKVAHAYLLAGPSGIGKGTLALRLAQALVCERGGPAPCLECRACRRVAHGNHPDVRTISLATQAAAQKSDETKSRELRIDTVREWQRDIDLRPFEASRRVFLLHDADKLNEQAANAMLKTLEEPPPYAVLILIAHGAGDLLPTIVSRCRVLRLRPLPRALIATALQQRYDLAPEDAALLAAWSGGRFGWAVGAVEQPEILDEQREQLDRLIELRANGRVAQLKWAEERAKDYRSDQAGVLQWLALWQALWRDVLLHAAGCGDAATYIDRRAELAGLGANVPLERIHEFLRRLDDVRAQLVDNVNPQLALENLALHQP
jgi:DNA polymerase-3 subunit delta'